METLLKKPEKGRKATLRYGALLFLFMLLFTFNAISAVSAGTPLISAEDAESAALAEAQKEAENQTILNYILMGVGIVIVIGVSWFTGIGKKKKPGTETQERHHVVKNQHSSHDKRYGSNRQRGLRHS